MATAESTIYILDQRGNVERYKRAESWVRWFYRILCGLLLDANKSVRVHAGPWYTIRTSGDYNSAPVVILLGSDPTPPSFDDYWVKSLIVALATTTTLSAIPGGYAIRVSGSYTPTADVSIGEICFFQDVYDAGGSLRTVLYFRDVFSPPYLHPANVTKTYVVELKVMV